MARGKATRVTAKDIAKAGAIGPLIELLVKTCRDGDTNAKEMSVCKLHSLAEQNHYEHTDALYAAGAVGPLVQLLNFPSTANAQSSAAAALAAISYNKPTHQQALVTAGAVVPLVKLIKTGSARVQEAAAVR